MAKYTNLQREKQPKSTNFYHKNPTIRGNYLANFATSKFKQSNTPINQKTPQLIIKQSDTWSDKPNTCQLGLIPRRASICNEGFFVVPTSAAKSQATEHEQLSHETLQILLNVSSTIFISVNQRVSSSPSKLEGAGGSVVHAKGGITHSSGSLDHLHQLREGTELQQLNFVELTLLTGAHIE